MSESLTRPAALRAGGFIEYASRSPPALCNLLAAVGSGIEKGHWGMPKRQKTSSKEAKLRKKKGFKDLSFASCASCILIRKNKGIWAGRARS